MTWQTCAMTHQILYHNVVVHLRIEKFQFGDIGRWLFIKGNFIFISQDSKQARSESFAATADGKQRVSRDRLLIFIIPITEPFGIDHFVFLNNSHGKTCYFPFGEECLKFSVNTSEAIW